MLNMLPILWAALVAQTPDSATTARYAAALKSVEDSLAGIRGTVANFRTDLAAASPTLILARSGRVHTRCVAARSAVAELHTVLASLYTPRVSEAQGALRRETAGLARALERCEREWDATPQIANADSLRAWGPYRIAQLEHAMRRYHTRAREFRTRARIN